MDNWRSYTNYRKYKNNDGAILYFIRVDGVDVEVSEAIYEEYSAAARKMKYMELDLKRNRVLQNSEGKAVRDENGQTILLPEREVSLDKLSEEDWDFRSAEFSPEEIVEEQLEVKALYGCLKLLEDDEREFIIALFFSGMTEREYSTKTGIPQRTINDRKHRILGKLKNFLKKY